MGYETAPATQMLGVHCICCSRELVQAESLEASVGPTCRKKYGFNKAQTEPDWERASEMLGGVPADLPAWGRDAVRVANQLVYRIAADRTHPNVSRWIMAVHHVGFTKIAGRVANRLRLVHIRLEKRLEVVVLKAPKAEPIFKVRGRRWMPEERANHFPASSQRALHHALCDAFPWQLAVGPKGLFLLRPWPVSAPIAMAA